MKKLILAEGFVLASFIVATTRDLGLSAFTKRIHLMKNIAVLFDGIELKKMVFGDKKNPDYKIDELGRVVYYRADGNEIQGFTF